VKPAPVFHLEGVTVRRQGTEILRGVTWRFDQGQHWALLGPNGCGKTTLLKVLAGYEWATTGSVEVLGERFGECSIPDLRKRIGWAGSFLAQRFHDSETPLNIVVTGFEASLGRFREFTPDEVGMAVAALERLGAGSILDKPYGVLSQGERQRVLIARSIVHSPRLLVLDEPCAGLDPSAREAFLDDVEQFAAAAHAPSIIFVTHHIEEIRPHISHAMVMKDGLALASGPTEAVLRGGALAEAFGLEYRVDKRHDGYAVHVRRPHNGGAR